MGEQVGCGILYYRVGDVSEDSLRLCAPYETRRSMREIPSRFLHRLSAQKMNFGISPLGEREGKPRSRCATTREGARDRCGVRDGGKILGGNVGLLYTGLFSLLITLVITDTDFRLLLYGVLHAERGAALLRRRLLAVSRLAGPVAPGVVAPLQLHDQPAHGSVLFLLLLRLSLLARMIYYKLTITGTFFVS